MSTNETHKPHTAVISIQLEVHSLLETGECSGRTVNSRVLNEYGIKDAFIVAVNGFTLDDCLRKLKSKLERLQNDTE